MITKQKEIDDEIASFSRAIRRLGTRLEDGDTLMVEWGVGIQGEESDDKESIATPWRPIIKPRQNEG